MPSERNLAKYWSLPADELLRALGSSPRGLSAEEARQRLGAGGQNILAPAHRHAALRLFLDRFRSPLLLILVFAALVSLVVVAYVAIAFVVTGKFVVSAFAMLLLVFMTDFAKIALATERVRPSSRPETWGHLEKPTARTDRGVASSLPPRLSN